MPPPVPPPAVYAYNYKQPLVPPLYGAFLLLLCRVIDATKAKEIKGSAGAPSEAENDAYELLRTLVRARQRSCRAKWVGPHSFTSSCCVCLVCIVSHIY